jgi:hypothetical protein
MMIVGAVGVMQLYWIDEDDEGSYHYDTVLLHHSRKYAAERRQYNISAVGTSVWDVRRIGGATHRVIAYRCGGILAAWCDCYDFVTYGAARNRACQHIWKVVLTQELQEW